MTLRALGYVRQSKTRQNETNETSLSLDAQEARIRAYCEAQGWALAEVYRDGDVVGDDPNRPALREAIAAAESGGYEALVVFALSRLARDHILQETIWRRLRAANTRLVSVTEPNADDDMVRGIMGVVSAGERKRMGRFLAAAFRQRVERGLHHGVAPFGYRQQPKPTDDAEYVSILPDPDEAPIVREVFQRYRGGEGSTAIAVDLTQRGITSPRGRATWAASGVLDLLRNPVYIGQGRSRGEVRAGRWEPIVSRAVWDDCQRLLAAPGRSARTAYPKRSPLQGLIWCGCGAKMWMAANHPHANGAPAYRFRCSRSGTIARRTTKQPDHKRSIMRDVAETVVLEQVRHALDHLATVEDVLERENARLTAEAPDRQERLTTLTKRRNALEARHARVEAWYLEGRRDAAWAAGQDEEIAAELAEVDAELAHVPPAPNPLAFAALQRLLIDTRQQLQRATANDLRNLLLQLGARVEVHDGDVRVLFPPPIAAFLCGR